MPEFHDDDTFGSDRVGVTFLNLQDPRHGQLEQYNKGEGGSYINDYFRMHSQLRCSSTRIPKKYAQMILVELGINQFHNKNFVRINSNEELEGMRDEPMYTFLYLHDYTYYLYDLM